LTTPYFPGRGWKRVNRTNRVCGQRRFFVRGAGEFRRMRTASGSITSSRQFRPEGFFRASVQHVCARIRFRREGKTKQCSDCHVSAANDNNACGWRRCCCRGNEFHELHGPGIFFVATGKQGVFEAITVCRARRAGSDLWNATLQRLAYPDNYKNKFVAGKGKTRNLRRFRRALRARFSDIQVRGEVCRTRANGQGRDARV